MRMLSLALATLVSLPTGCSSDPAAEDAGVDAPTEDGGPPDAAPTPGEFPGDIADLKSCEDVCAEQRLICDARNRWSGFLLSDPGGGQGAYRSAGGSTTTEGFGCFVLPPTTVEIDSVFELESYRCACTVAPGGILDDVEQMIEFNGVYQGAFTLSEPATVTYQIDDNYRVTANHWRVAIVPIPSVDTYLAGETPLVYGEFNGTGSTRATADLPSDDYALVLACQNVRDRCSFHTLVTLE